MTKVVDHPAFNIAIFAVLRNLRWEFWRMRLYAGAAQMTHLQGIRICTADTIGDAGDALSGHRVCADPDVAGCAVAGALDRPSTDRKISLLAAATWPQMTVRAL